MGEAPWAAARQFGRFGARGRWWSRDEEGLNREDETVNLHYMLSKAVAKSRPNVLWCYKDELELSRFLLSHRKEYAKKVKELMQMGLLHPEMVDTFSVSPFIAGIQYCQYENSERILGNTFGMLVLQDFEAVTKSSC